MPSQVSTDNVRAAFSADRPPSLVRLASYAAGHLNTAARTRLTPQARRRGLSLPQFAVLTALTDFGDLPQHELAARLRLNRSHLVGYLDGLEEARLVRRRPDPNDRRVTRVQLTAKGRTTERELTSAADEVEDELLAGLSATERRTLARLLVKALDAL